MKASRWNDFNVLKYAVTSICANKSVSGIRQVVSAYVLNEILMMIASKGALQTILVVDDDRTIMDKVSRWLARAGYRFLQATSGAEAWRCLQSNEVHLVTLDAAMRGESGLEFLATIKTQFPEIPVLMLAASGRARTAIEAMAAGACGYLMKPVERVEFLFNVIRGLEWRQLWLERRAYTYSLEQKVWEQTREIREAHEETIHRLVAATTCRDEETGAHIVRTGVFSEILAQAAGWSSTEAKRLGFAAPMHDIGKIGIPDAILQKPGRLNPQEYDVMKGHTTIGADILAGSRSPVLQMAQQIALRHHERYDGNGYPDGLRGEAIPQAAQIVSIVDVYDALTHDRVYRPAMPEGKAIAILHAQQGRQFASALLTTFFTVLDEIQELAKQYPDEIAVSRSALASMPESKPSRELTARSVDELMTRHVTQATGELS